MDNEARSEPATCEPPVSGVDSGELMSRLGRASFPEVDCLGAAGGGGEEGMTTEANEDLSVPCRPGAASGGEGND